MIIDPDHHAVCVSVVAKRAVRGPRAARGGFSLIELLVVVSILAILGGAVVVVFNGIESGANEKIATAEMQQVKQAVLRFYRDTGYLPKQGPFQRDNVDDAAAGASAAWFDSPANFDQLYSNPLDGSGAGGNGGYGGLVDQLKSYDAQSRRGWNGPYLTDGPRRYIAIGDGLNADDGSGSPTAGTLIEDVPMVADPHLARPVGGYLAVWDRPVALAGAQSLERAGRPYLLLGLDNGPDEADPDLAPRIVGFGDNGEYEQGGGDDVTLFLFQ